MKRIILTIALVFALLKIDAQTQYDTIIFHPYNISECPMGLSIEYYNEKAKYCDSCYPFWQYPCLMQGSVTGSNQYGVQGVAQPYHFDSIVTIIGIAVKIPTSGLSPSLYGTVFFRIMDIGFNQLSQIPIYPWYTPDSNGYKWHIFPNEVQVKDFVLAGDIAPFSYYNNDFDINYPCT